MEEVRLSVEFDENSMDRAAADAQKSVDEATAKQAEKSRRSGNKSSGVNRDYSGTGPSGTGFKPGESRRRMEERNARIEAAMQEDLARNRRWRPGMREVFAGSAGKVFKGSATFGALTPDAGMTVGDKLRAAMAAAGVAGKGTVGQALGLGDTGNGVRGRVELGPLSLRQRSEKELPAGQLLSWKGRRDDDAARRSRVAGGGSWFTDEEKKRTARAVGGRVGGTGTVGNAVRGLGGIAAASAVGSAIGAGGQALGGAMTGNLGTVGSAVSSGIQSVGNMLMFLGPKGMIAGMALKAVAAAGEAVAGLLNKLVEELGQYSANVMQKQAELDVATEQFKIKMAAQTEDLMVAWVELKQELLGLLEDLAPLIQVVIDGLKGLVNILKFFTGAQRAQSQLTAGPIANLLSPGAWGRAEKSRASNSIENLNAMMLNDLGGGSAPAGGGGGAAGGTGNSGGMGSLFDWLSGRSPGGSTGHYQTPGGGGVNFNVQQHYQLRLEDAAAVDRACESVRERLMEAFLLHRDRVEVMAGALDGRNAAQLTI